MKNVLVFGGSGFIGSYVADELTRRGYDVLVADKDNSCRFFLKPSFFQILKHFLYLI